MVLRKSDLTVIAAVAFVAAGNQQGGRDHARPGFRNFLPDGNVSDQRILLAAPSPRWGNPRLFLLPAETVLSVEIGFQCRLGSIIPDQLQPSAKTLTEAVICSKITVEIVLIQPCLRIGSGNIGNRV